MHCALCFCQLSEGEQNMTNALLPSCNYMNKLLSLIRKHIHIYNCVSTLFSDKNISVYNITVSNTIFVCQARDSRLRGDFAAAKSYGDKARCLNIAAFFFGLCSIIAFIVLIFKSVNELNRYQY